MKITLAQMKMSDDIETNFKKSLDCISAAAKEDSDLVLFPEIQLTHFFPQYRKNELSAAGIDPNGVFIDEDDEKIKLICEAAAKNNIFVSPNFYVRDKNKKFYDRSFFITPEGKISGTSDMVNIFSAENFYEKDYYTPSEKGYIVYDTPFGKTGIVICFDRHVGESVRSCAFKGAQLVLIPTANLLSEPLDLFEAEVRTLAYQNNVFIAMCNRTGKEGNVIFAGESVIVDPDGNIITKAGRSEENITAEIDLEDSVKSREKRNYIQFAADPLNTQYVTPSGRR